MMPKLTAADYVEAFQRYGFSAQMWEGMTLGELAAIAADAGVAVPADDLR
jgi:hypothetical protein